MSHYAQVVRNYWTQALPSRWQEMTPPEQETFVQGLAEQISLQVADLSAQMETTQAAELSPDFMQRVGQLTAIRMQAEEFVLADLVYSHPPEAGTEAPVTGPEAVMRPDGMPIDPDHPLWALMEAWETEGAEEAFMTAWRDWRAQIGAPLTP